jgi:hypothetical protein
VAAYLLPTALLLAIMKEKIKEQNHMRGSGAKSSLFLRCKNPRGKKPQERIDISWGLTVT